MMKKYGLTLVEIMIVIIIIGLLALIAVPNFTTSANRVRRDTCINNLIQIDLAKEQWALENNLEVGDAGSTPDAEDLDPYIREDIWDAGYTTGHSLICPLDSSGTPTFGTSYTINAFGDTTPPACNISPADHHL